jgi:GNAT superfamily N-acetyltransferase
MTHITQLLKSQLPEYIRTTSSSVDFQMLVNALDEDLYQRNGEIQKQYEQYNQIDKIKNAIVVYTEGNPIGCGCFKPFDNETIEVKRMFVLPEMRGKKLAEGLLHELEKWAIEEGYSKAVLETGRRQVEAIRL